MSLAAGAGGAEAQLREIRCYLRKSSPFTSFSLAFGKMCIRDSDQVKKLFDGLTENEKAMLGEDALSKVDTLAEQIKKLAEEANSPKTGDTSNLALWIALLFISGGVFTALTVKRKKSYRPGGNAK